MAKIHLIDRRTHRHTGLTLYSRLLTQEGKSAILVHILSRALHIILMFLEKTPAAFYQNHVMLKEDLRSFTGVVRYGELKVPKCRVVYYEPIKLWKNVGPKSKKLGSHILWHA